MAFTVATYIVESFELFNTDVQAMAGGKWDAGSSCGVQWTTTGARRSGHAIGQYSAQYYFKTVPAAQDWAINRTFNATTIYAGTLDQLMDGATAQVDLRVDASGHLQVTRNGTVLGTSTQTMANGLIYAIEWLVHIANSPDGWTDVNVNGVNWLHITGADTQNSGNASATVYKVGSTSGAFVYVDDLLVRAGSGLSTSDSLVDVGVQALAPTSDVSNTNWTKSTGATFYGVVDEMPANSTDYNYSTTVGAESSHGHSDLASTNYVIVGPVVYSVWAAKDDVGARTIKLFCTSNGTTVYSDAFTVLDSYQYFFKQFALDPDGNKAWTAAAVNAATFGYRLDS